MDRYDQLRRHIVNVLGDGPDHIEPGRIVRFSADGRRTKKSGWCLAFDGEPMGGVFGDFRTGVKSCWWPRSSAPPNFAERQRRRDRMQAAMAQSGEMQRREWAIARERNDSLWQDARPIHPDDPVGVYLRRRGLVTKQFPQALRFHPCVRYFEDGRLIETFPAMLGLVMNDGSAVAIHRTYLTSDGYKAPVCTAKKLTATTGPMSGASIQLGEPRPANGLPRQLGVAEGIETALAAMLASGIPTVAAISASGLARFAIPSREGVDELTIFGDNDANGVGQAAAAALEKRAIAHGMAVRKLIPSEVGMDWADVWAAAGEVHG